MMTDPATGMEQCPMNLITSVTEAEIAEYNRERDGLLDKVLSEMTLPELFEEADRIGSKYQA